MSGYETVRCRSCGESTVKQMDLDEWPVALCADCFKKRQKRMEIDEQQQTLAEVSR